MPEEIRKGYFKVKVLELLLFLSALPTERRRPAYSGAQVRLASAVSRVSALRHGGAPHNGGALRKVPRLGHADIAELPGRLRHVSGGVSARSENARRGGASPFHRPDGARYRRAVRIRQRQQICPRIPQRHRRIPQRLPQRHDRRQLRTGLIRIPPQKQHFGAAFAHFGADTALRLAYDNHANRETLPRMYAFPPCHIISHPFVRCGPEGGLTNV